MSTAGVPFSVTRRACFHSVSRAASSRSAFVSAARPPEPHSAQGKGINRQHVGPQREAERRRRTSLANLPYFAGRNGTRTARFPHALSAPVHLSTEPCL